MKRELIAAVTFGLEAVVKREIQALGYEILKTENGKVTFSGDERAIVRSNLWLRTADRIQLKMGEFPAEESEELFQTVKGMPWEELIPIDGAFPVIVSTVKSKLRSEPINQKTVKKAIVERLSDFYGVEHFEETGPEYRVKLTLLKDRATITVDTTGPGLHKRGYRQEAVAAPLKETIAAAMLELSFWKPGRVLLDPCCGSGTIPIEAAMIGRNIAPGLSREFVSEGWDIIRPELWKEERKKARERMDFDTPLDIRACDIDRAAYRASLSNAEEAGVLEDIDVSCMDMKKILDPETLPESGVIVMNPPYGERIGDAKTIGKIYDALSAFLKARPDWSLFVITADKEIESRVAGRKADRRRKLYNGRMEVCYYQFHGEKPIRHSDHKEPGGSRKAERKD